MATGAKRAFPPASAATLLSHLLLAPTAHAATAPAFPAGATQLTRAEFDDLAALANTNHVVIRGMRALGEIYASLGDSERLGWAEEALSVEQARIAAAIPVLERVLAALGRAGLAAMVIKSLDHWPDLGSDLDLYTDADAHEVTALLAREFGATVAPQSWGDKLACKWNYLLPELPEAIEIHMGKLGQMGEQSAIADHLLARSRVITVGTHAFRTTSPSDRILISTLQRMYRHFFFRLCDVVDSAGLVERGELDFADLEGAATAADIWEGTATYLVIVSDYVEKYRGYGLALPDEVRAAARFGGKEVYYARQFLRVPIVPQSAKLYGRQLTGLLLRGHVENSARLSLLPWLAGCAFLGEKFTGSDKGIW